MRLVTAHLGALLLVFAATGCQTGGAAESRGKTFYLDGAGNWGYGGTGVVDGLRAAGYTGNIEEYVWTTSFNPLVDQLNIVAAKIRSRELARRLDAYGRRFPDQPLNIVAHSAGTGVAVWAIEQLQGGSKIDNLIMLGSSLSHDYDVSAALDHMRGRIIVYSSPHDCVLESVRTIGTIDGKRGVDSVGLVGLDAPPGFEDRIVNTRWSRDWLKLGWCGAHTDCMNAVFVRHELSKYILGNARSAENLLTRAGDVGARVEHSAR